MGNGTGLCASACKAVQAMLSHVPLFALLTFVQRGIFWFGKIAISFFTAGLCGLIIQSAYASQISSIVLPVCICLLIGYSVASTFICVFDMGIDTMLGCYAEADINSDLKDFIPHELRDTLDKKRDTDE